MRVRRVGGWSVSAEPVGVSTMGGESVRSQWEHACEGRGVSGRRVSGSQWDRWSGEWWEGAHDASVEVVGHTFVHRLLSTAVHEYELGAAATMAAEMAAGAVTADAACTIEELGGRLEAAEAEAEAAKAEAAKAKAEAAAAAATTATAS
eukprot:1283844-Prymnesium_polylepis.1